MKNNRVGGWSYDLNVPELTEEQKLKMKKAIKKLAKKTAKKQSYEDDAVKYMTQSILEAEDARILDALTQAPYYDKEWGTPDPIPEEVKHGWIQLYSGRKFYPLDPKVEDIDIEDIAHSLSNMCRFTGHVKHFYSVAQHSVLVSYLCGDTNALYGLLHDSTEAYLVDMPRPIKRLPTFVNFREIENNIMKVIAKRFGLADTEPKAVKSADIRLLATEARDLMSPLHPEWIQPCEPYPFKIEPLNPAEAKKLFLDRYRELTNG